MKITKTRIKQIIKEEIAKVLNEGDLPPAGDPYWALTPGQVMVKQEAAIEQDETSDLYGILLNAKTDSSYADLLDHPAFQKDPRVKKLGY